MLQGTSCESEHFLDVTVDTTVLFPLVSEDIYFSEQIFYAKTLRVSLKYTPRHSCHLMPKNTLKHIIMFNSTCLLVVLYDNNMNYPLMMYT